MRSEGVLSGLAVEDLTVRFGGLVAVDNISLSVPRATLTGLIGPNGAGKTTTFNACSGLLRPSAGTVRLFGHVVTKLPPQRRAQRGLGRTFQRMELFDRLTVAENVAMGREVLFAGSRPLGPIWQSHTERKTVHELAEAAIELCGIGHLQQRPAGLLSTGQRRLVELARAVASDFKLLLLDEPSSGLDATETEQFGRILDEVVAARSTGILLVEHDMSLVTTVCDYLYVLDFGKLIEEGPTQEVMASETVRAAYLGTEVA